MAIKFTKIILFIFIVECSSGCTTFSKSTSFPSSTLTPSQVSFSSTPTIPHAHSTLSSAPKTSIIPSIPPTLTPLPTFTPTLEIEFEVRLLSKNIYGWITTAFWSSDGSTIYYATAENSNQRSLEWFAIDVNNRQESKLFSPPRIERTPLLNPKYTFTYPEYEGFISPSGQYRIEIETTATGESYHNQSNIESTVWFVDVNSGNPNEKILEGTDLILRRAEWLPDEAGVIFGIGSEYGTYLYLLNSQNKTLTTIQELIGFDDINLLEWALSPDGTMIAIVDGNGYLHIFSLGGIHLLKLDKFFSFVKWSSDSQALYYFYGDEWYQNDAIGTYDLKSGISSMLFTLLELEKRGIEGISFDISPSRNDFIFWGTKIWLVTILDPNT